MALRSRVANVLASASFRAIIPSTRSKLRSRDIFTTSRAFQQQSGSTVSDEVSDKPIAYSQHETSNWPSHHAFKNYKGEDPPPPYQHYVVILSFATFMIYFCVLREANDIDEKIDDSLFLHMDPLDYKKRLLKRLSEMEDKNENIERLKEKLVLVNTVLDGKAEYGGLQMSLNKIKAEKEKAAVNSGRG